MPEDYFVAQSTSYVNLICLRGFVVDGSTESASQMFRNGVKIYPLDHQGDPPPMEYINGSGRAFNTIHANTFGFYAVRSAPGHRPCSRSTSSARRPGA